MDTIDEKLNYLVENGGGGGGKLPDQLLNASGSFSVYGSTKAGTAPNTPHNFLSTFNDTYAYDNGTKYLMPKGKYRIIYSGSQYNEIGSRYSVHLYLISLIGEIEEIASQNIPANRSGYSWTIEVELPETKFIRYAGKYDGSNYDSYSTCSCGITITPII